MERPIKMTKEVWQDSPLPSCPLSFIFSPTASGEKENGRKDKRDVVTFS